MSDLYSHSQTPAPSSRSHAPAWECSPAAPAARQSHSARHLLNETRRWSVGTCSHAGASEPEAGVSHRSHSHAPASSSRSHAPAWECSPAAPAARHSHFARHLLNKTRRWSVGTCSHAGAWEPEAGVSRRSHSHAPTSSSRSYAPAWECSPAAPAARHSHSARHLLNETRRWSVATCSHAGAWEPEAGASRRSHSHAPASSSRSHAPAWECSPAAPAARHSHSARHLRDKTRRWSVGTCSHAGAWKREETRGWSVGTCSHAGAWEREERGC